MSVVMLVGAGPMSDALQAIGLGVVMIVVLLIWIVIATGPRDP